MAFDWPETLSNVFWVCVWPSETVSSYSDSWRLTGCRIPDHFWAFEAWSVLIESPSIWSWISLKLRRTLWICVSWFWMRIHLVLTYGTRLDVANKVHVWKLFIHWTWGWFSTGLASLAFLIILGLLRVFFNHEKCQLTFICWAIKVWTFSFSFMLILNASCSVWELLSFFVCQHTLWCYIFSVYIACFESMQTCAKEWLVLCVRDFVCC